MRKTQGKIRKKGKEKGKMSKKVKKLKIKKNLKGMFSEFFKFLFGMHRGACIRASLTLFNFFCCAFQFIVRYKF